MGIGYFQLTVTSEQDKYLVGNPEFTYFKAVYKKHTNFAKETFNLNFVGETFMESNNNLGKKLYCTIPKNGDLLHRMYLVFDIQSVSPPKKKNDGTIDTTIETIKKNVLPYISIDAGMAGFVSSHRPSSKTVLSTILNSFLPSIKLEMPWFASLDRLDIMMSKKQS